MNMKRIEWIIKKKHTQQENNPNSIYYALN